MEALLTALAQYGPGGIMAGAVCWLCYHLVTKTIPDREKEHRAEMQSMTLAHTAGVEARDKAHAAALESMRVFYSQWLEAERSAFREGLAKQERHGEILLELRDAIHECTGNSARRRESQ